MAQQIINTAGGPPYSTAADTLPSAFNKCNQNFTELYATVAGYVTSSTLNGYFADPSTNPSFSPGAWRTDIDVYSTSAIDGFFADPTTNGSFDAGAWVTALNAAVTNASNTFTANQIINPGAGEGNLRIIGNGFSAAILDLYGNGGGTAASRWHIAALSVGNVITITNDVSAFFSFAATGNFNASGNLSALNLSGTNTGDQTASTVANTPSGNISSVTVQGAINELDSEKAKLSGGNTFTGNQVITGTVTADGLTTTTEIVAPKTITPPATTGDQTINKIAGSVNFASAATSLTVTNSVVTTNSVIICTVATNDATFTSAQAVAGSGSFQIFANAAATAETRVNFLIIN